MKKHTCLLALVSALASISTSAQVSITTWNMEHMMSSKVFKEWRAYCEPLGWVEPAKEVEKPSHLTYCNALSGQTMGGNKESLPLHTEFEYSKKLQALSSARMALKSDLFALQEVGDDEAVSEVFPLAEFDIYFFKPANPADTLAQNLAFAVRKSGKVKVVKAEPYDALGIMSFEGRRIRPGLLLIADVEGTEVAFLNLHLKAGCRSEPLGEESRVHACGDFRKQVPPLEAWIEAQARAKRDFVVLGDWNRTLLESDLTPQQRQRGANHDNKHPARMDTKESAASPLLPSIKVGSMLKEISDDEPQGASLIVARSEISARKKAVEGEGWDHVCHLGIDHFALSPFLASRFAKQMPVAKGQDYGNSAYARDKAKPSDHCPLTLVIPAAVR